MNEENNNIYHLLEIGFAAICAGFIYGTYHTIKYTFIENTLNYAISLLLSIIIYGVIAMLIQFAILSIYRAYSEKYNPKLIMILVFIGCFIVGMLKHF